MLVAARGGMKMRQVLSSCQLRAIAAAATFTVLGATPALANDGCDPFSFIEGTFATNQGELWIDGVDRNDYLGIAVTSAGDFNGDGVEDFAVSASGRNTNGTNTGEVFLFYGPVSDAGALSPADADAVLVGAGFNDNTGFSIAGGGDVDGDGFDDLVIGTNPGNGSTILRGMVYVVYGRSGLLGPLDIASDASTARVFGENNFDEFGSSVAIAGDVNGDGVADIIVGAPGFNGAGDSLGRVYLILGPIAPVLTPIQLAVTKSWTGDTDFASLGVAVSGVGDVNNDGYDDFLLGSPRSGLGGANSGAAFLVLGRPLFDSTPEASINADAIYTGRAFDRAGASLSRAGDANSDGFADFWIGSKQQGSTKRGAAYLIHGSANPAGSNDLDTVRSAVLFGESANNLAGSSIAGGVDFNGDGIFDVVIGGERGNGAVTQSGVAWVKHGPFTGEANLSTADAKINGSEYLNFTGSAVAAFGDINGDGFGDVAVGSWRMNGANANTGRLTVLFGGGTRASDLVTFYADQDGDGFGDPGNTTLACSAPPGFVANDQDCNDIPPEGALFYPGAPEGCDDPDYNCDGFTGANDNDGDGFAACLGECTGGNITPNPHNPGLCGGDCNDGVFEINPGADEVCGDGIDNNCDGNIDDANAVDALWWFADLDGDSWGRDAGAIKACTQPSIFLSAVVNRGGDCNDENPLINPGAFEVCDGVDNNCDGDIDVNAIDAPTWFADVDGDGFGDRLSTSAACSVPSGYVADFTDCDDTDPAIKPGATEVCDYIDNNCDGRNYIGGPMSAGSASRMSIVGKSAGDRIGETVDFLGDQDGDGLDELVIGAPWSSPEGRTHAGAVYIKRGVASGGDLDFDVVRDDGVPTWDVELYGTRSNAFFGHAVATGDYNGDGVEDIAVTAWGARVPRQDMGAVYVFLGPLQNGSFPAESADMIIRGGSQGDRLGWSIDAADLDGDGLDDLVIGAPRNGDVLPNQGAAYVVYGRDPFIGDTRINQIQDAVIYGAEDGAAAGFTVAAGDLNADGFGEVIVGSPEFGALNNGSVDIVYGSAARLSGITSSSSTLTGLSNLEQLGLALAAGGDVNGDGIEDLLIGTFGNRAHLVLGTPGNIASAVINAVPSAIRFNGTLGQNAGESVAFVGDVNGDGFEEFVVSAHRSNDAGQNAGMVFFVYGRANYDDYRVPVGSGSVALNTIESFGRIEGDLLFPTYSASNLVVPEGAKLRGEKAQSQFGRPVASGGDINGDGIPDIIVGAPRFDRDPNNLTVGKVYVFAAGPYGIDHPDADPDTKVTYIWDWDADGWADIDMSTFVSCPMHAPISFRDPTNPILRGTTDASLALDCNDFDHTIYPGAPETNDDGVDSNCDGFDNINVPPTGNVNLSPRPAFHGTDISAVINITDPDKTREARAIAAGDPVPDDDVILTINWFLDDVPTGVLDPSGLVWPGFVARRGQNVRLEVLADDTRDVAGPFSSSVTISNTAPVINSCAVSPAEDANVATQLRALPGTVVDPDPEDTPTVNLQWQQRFGPLWVDIAGETGELLASCVDRGNACVRGNELRVVCRATDGIALSAPVPSPAVILQNAPPVMESCVITPASPDTLDDLTVTAAANDPDNDPVTVAYQWMKNGEPIIGATNAVLASSETYRFDAIGVRCTPTDELGLQGAGMNATPIVIRNTPPTAPSIAMVPPNPRSNQDVMVDITSPSTDVDNDPITYAYYWRRNGVQFPNPTYPTNINTVQRPSTTRDDVWEVSVVASDGFAESPSVSATFTVRNTPPQIDDAVLTPSAPVATQNIDAQGVGWYDEDGDVPTYLVAWYIDGVLQPSTSPATRLPAGEAARGQDVYAVMTPFDGEQGTSVTSNTVTVQNAPPTQPAVRIEPELAGFENDDLLCAITTASTDPDGDPVVYHYSWYRNGSLFLEGVGLNVIDSDDTEFGDIWRCEVTPSDVPPSGFAALEGPTAVSAQRAITSTEEPPPPTFSATSRYRNDTTFVLEGTCIAGTTNCNQVHFSCTSDGVTMPVASVSCTCANGNTPDAVGCGGGSVDGEFTRTTTVTRGETVICRAECEDVASNLSPLSGTTVTEACDPRDQFEDDTNYGDVATNPIDEWGTLSHTNDFTVQVNGNVIDGDVHDWFRFSTANDPIATAAAGRNPYNFRASMDVGDGQYDMVVWRDDPTGTPECAASVPYKSYSFYNWDRGDAPDKGVPADRQACAAAGTPDEGFFNRCQDLSATYYVRMSRSVGTNCQHYRLRVSNGTTTGLP